MNCKSNLFETYWAFLRCDIKRFPLCRLPIGYIEIDAVTDVFNSQNNWMDPNETVQINDEWIYTARFMKGDLTNVSPVGGGRSATDSNMSMWLKPNEGNYITTFLLSFIIFTIWEYFVGWFLEKVFHTK